MTERILVLGGTGSTGRRLVELLRAADVEVRAASRSGAVRFDWTDRDTWEPALRGTSAMYLMAPDGQPIEPDLVRLAVGLGARRIVLLSSQGIEVMGDERLIDAERLVRDSGADWTILRCNWFAQNFDEGFFQPAVVGGELALPLGDLAQAFVDAGDIAAVAAAALTEPGHAGQAYDVDGPESLTFGEALDIIGEVSGRTIRYLPDDADFLAAQAEMGEPVEAANGALAAFTALREAGTPPPSGVVEQVTGRPAKDFRSYARDAAAAWT